MFGGCSFMKTAKKCGSCTLDLRPQFAKLARYELFDGTPGLFKLTLHTLCLISVIIQPLPAIAKLVPGAGEVQRLLKDLRSGSVGQRDRATQRLYHVQDPSANAAVMEMASEPTDGIRVVAFHAISVIRPAGGEAIVLKGLHDAASSVRAAAALAAGALHLKKAVKRLARMAKEKNTQVRGAAIVALSRVGAAGIRYLVRLLSAGKIDQRLLAAAALADSRHPRASAILRHAAQSGPPSLRLLIAKKLQMTDARWACNALRKLSTTHFGLGTRLQAIADLTTCLDRRSHAQLIALQRDKHPSIQRAARRALFAQRKDLH